MEKGNWIDAIVGFCWQQSSRVCVCTCAVRSSFATINYGAIKTRSIFHHIFFIKRYTHMFPMHATKRVLSIAVDAEVYIFHWEIFSHFSRAAGEKLWEERVCTKDSLICDWFCESMQNASIFNADPVIHYAQCAPWASDAKTDTRCTRVVLVLSCEREKCILLSSTAAPPTMSRAVWNKEAGNSIYSWNWSISTGIRRSPHPYPCRMHSVCSFAHKTIVHFYAYTCWEHTLRFRNIFMFAKSRGRIFR